MLWGVNSQSQWSNKFDQFSSKLDTCLSVVMPHQQFMDLFLRQISIYHEKITWYQLSDLRWILLHLLCIMCISTKCDVIRQNESELANTIFKIQPNKADSFFCFLLFVKSFNCLYLLNQLPNLCGIFTKLKPKQYPKRKCPPQKKKPKYHVFRLQTHFAWSHHKYIFTGMHWVYLAG